MGFSSTALLVSRVRSCVFEIAAVVILVQKKLNSKTHI